MNVLSLPNVPAPFSAFRSVPSRTPSEGHARRGLVPIDASLIPDELIHAFAVPVVSFDQREAPFAGAMVQPPFELPLAFAAPGCPPVSTQPDEPAGSPRDGLIVAPQCNPIQAHVVSTSCGADAKPLHKPRVVWTDELHQRFLRAIDAAGSDEAAVPTVILKLMNVSGLSRDNVASHLQKHRLGLKRGKSRKRRQSTLQGMKNKSFKGEDGTAADQAYANEFAADEGMHDMAEMAAQEREAAKSCDTSKPVGNEMQSAEPSREGEGNDCEGSNERDDCDANEGPASDDGAGAGSDNRTACNVSGMDAGETAGQAAHLGDFHRGGAGKGQSDGDTGISESPAAPDGGAGSNREGSQDQKGTETSLFQSGSGSNNASKQQITSNGQSGANRSGSEPTAGSRTAGAGQSTNKGAAQLPQAHQWSAAHAAGTGLSTTPIVSAPPHTATAGQSAAAQSSGAQKEGPRFSRELVPVGIPLRLPSDIQVPLGNTQRICAPRTGDGL
eukprot:jgi/Ulvmu1/5284/UM022_0078.1